MANGNGGGGASPQTVEVADQLREAQLNALGSPGVSLPFLPGVPAPVVDYNVPYSQGLGGLGGASGGVTPFIDQRLMVDPNNPTELLPPGVAPSPPPSPVDEVRAELEAIRGPERFPIAMDPHNTQLLTAEDARRVTSPVRNNPNAVTDAMGNVIDLGEGLIPIEEEGFFTGNWRKDPRTQFGFLEDPHEWRNPTTGEEITMPDSSWIPPSPGWEFRDPLVADSPWQQSPYDPEAPWVAEQAALPVGERFGLPSDFPDQDAAGIMRARAGNITDPGLNYPTETIDHGGGTWYTGGPYTGMPIGLAEKKSAAIGDYAHEGGPSTWEAYTPPATDPGLDFPIESGPNSSWYMHGPYAGLNVDWAAQKSRELGPERWGSPRSTWMARGTRGSTAGLAAAAAKGRYGDSMLVHMAPEEVAGLASLTQNGVTINPDTGLPEMFNLGSLLPMIVGIGASFIPGVGPLAAAALSGLTTAATTKGNLGERLGRGLLAGLGSYAFSGLASKIGSAGVPEAVSSGMGGGAGGVGAGGVDFTGALPGVASPIGGAASQAGLGGFQAASGIGGVGPQLMSPTGQPRTWGQLPKNLQSVLGDQGQYTEGMTKMVQSTSGLAKAPSPHSSSFFGVPDRFSEGLPPVGGSGAYASPQPQLAPGVRQEAFERAFAKPIEEWQRAEAYKQASPFDKVKYLRRGVEEGVDWNPRQLLGDAAAPGTIPIGSVVRPAAVAGFGFRGAGMPVEEPLVEEERRAGWGDPIDVEPRELAYFDPEYRPGIDPGIRYFAMGGTRGKTVHGGLPTLYAQNGIDVSSIMEEGPQGIEFAEDVEFDVGTPPGAPAPVDLAEMAASDAASVGIMEGAPPEAQDAVAGRLEERPIEGPQNPRERAIYDRAVLALQGELEPEEAQRAIDDFLEEFGPDALRTLEDMVRGERRNGGIVEPVNGETSVPEGEFQGPDLIPGKIVDPVTGEETANLRVGENEYIKTGADLARQAMAAGLAPTPQNGAMIEGMEEEALRRAVV
jgi:hypothetical protein